MAEFNEFQIVIDSEIHSSRFPKNKSHDHTPQHSERTVHNKVQLDQEENKRCPVVQIVAITGKQALVEQREQEQEQEQEHCECGW